MARRMPFWIVLSALPAAIVGLVWRLGGGWPGLAYALVYLLATAPGWPLGRMLFGTRHAASWIAGPLLGYALSAIVIWLVITLGDARPVVFGLAWGLLTALTWALGRLLPGPLVRLPAWTRRDTAALLLVLLLVPALTGPAFSRVGAADRDGRRYYRAYFTADFLWHVALTWELTRFRMPPGDPYASDKPLHYYWTYFLVPAAAAGAAPRAVLPTVEAILLVNALLAGLLSMAAVFLFAWAVLPRAAPAAVAVCLAIVAASAEGLYAIGTLVVRGAPLAELRELNIDAITLWFFRGLTIDGLPRSLWYTPQHAGACALGLIGLVVVGAEGGRARPAALALAGTALAAALAFSPFLGGAFVVIYALTVVWDLLARPRRIVSGLAWQALAAAPVLLALGWVVGNDMLAGAGGALHVGLAGHARHAPVLTLALALGPLLLAAVIGLWPVAAARPARPAIVALAVGLLLFYFVSLPGTDPIWVGWRAGQVLLVTLPGLAARGVAALTAARRLQPFGVTAIAALFAFGLPTTIVDAFNAQDIGNRGMGPGFPWTVVLEPDEQAALAWIRRATPPRAVVQMDPSARGRATWTLIPSFAARRMAAGLPISLVAMPYYQPRTDEVRAMYATPDASAAWAIARRLGIDYVYVGAAERDAYPAEALRKFGASPGHFLSTFRNAGVEIFAVKGGRGAGG